MGLNQTLGNGADFSKMLKSSEPVPIGRVIHKAYIEVNEAGTEAAAVTGRSLNIHSPRRKSYMVTLIPETINMITV